MTNIPSKKNGLLKHVFVYLVVIALNSLVLPWSVRAQTIKDIATDATDPNNLRGAEPSIAVDPTNPMRIAILSFSENWDATHNAPVWISTDGGAHWSKSTIIGVPSSGQGGSNDQKVAFDSTGRLVLAELDFAVNDFIYRQTGAPGTPLSAGAAFGNDQPHIDVDKTAASPCFNRTYAPWLNFGVAPERSTVERSPDFGVTVNATAAGNPAFPNRTTRIAVAPNGRAYI